MNKNIVEKLKNANKELSELGETVELVIVGGTLLTSLGIVKRLTFDIDYINKVNKRLIPILDKYGINKRVSGHENKYGEWTNDIHKYDALVLSNIKIYLISPERQIASRMFSDQRFDDLEEAIIKNKIDVKKFEKTLIEISKYCDPNYIREFKENKPILVSTYKKKGIYDEKSEIWKLFK